jgi:hypothetical protein
MCKVILLWCETSEVFYDAVQTRLRLIAAALLTEGIRVQLDEPHSVHSGNDVSEEGEGELVVDGSDDGHRSYTPKSLLEQSQQQEIQLRELLVSVSVHVGHPSSCLMNVCSASLCRTTHL